MSLNAAIEASMNAAVMYAVATTWNTRTYTDGFSIAAIGSMLTNISSDSSNPAGVFINEFTEVMNTADNVEPTTIGMSKSQWCQGVLKRSHVYRKIPKNIASKTNAKTSINRFSAMICPPSLIKSGHINDNWSPMMVPVTTPTAIVKIGRASCRERLYFLKRSGDITQKF